MSVFLLQMLVVMFADKRIFKRTHVPKDARRNKLDEWAGTLGNMFWLIALAYSIFLPFQLGSIWFYIGLCVFLIGLVLMAAATFNFIAAPPDQVIVRGAYHFSRHPMYLATLFIYLGCSIATASWIFLLISVISAFFWHRESLIEERYCLEVYGSAYQEYLNRTPRWIGVPKKYIK